MVRLIKNYWFITGLFFVAVLAWYFPDWGKAGGVLKTEQSSKIAVYVIFLIQGLVLPTGDIMRGIKRVRYHLALQSYIFLICPLVACFILLIMSDFLSDELILGFWFLAILPTAVSTALVYAGRSGGNQVVALFNVIISNVMAIFIVPLFMLQVMSEHGAAGIHPLPIILKVIFYILIPLIIGQCVRPWVVGLVSKYKSVFNQVNSLLVLFIVYSVFSNSVAGRFWQQHSSGMLMLTILLVLVMFVLLQIMSVLFIRLGKLKYEDAVSFYFCGNMKSLAVGVPFATSIFDNSNFEAGMILLPLICYGIIQFFLGGLVVNKLQAKR